MVDPQPEPDAMQRCYEALMNEPAADTCCKRICVFIERMIADGRREPHDEHLIVLANQLLTATRTYGVHVLALNDHLDNGDFAAALRVGRAMVDHEAMLSDIAAGRPVQTPSRPN